MLICIMIFLSLKLVLTTFHSNMKEMTLEEYEKVLEEKRKALQALKTEERKVDSEVFASMQQLANKKNNDDIFIKLVKPL